jgi:hypothetical protein
MCYSELVENNVEECAATTNALIRSYNAPSQLPAGISTNKDEEYADIIQSGDDQRMSATLAQIFQKRSKHWSHSSNSTRFKQFTS